MHGSIRLFETLNSAKLRERTIRSLMSRHKSVFYGWRFLMFCIPLFESRLLDSRGRCLLRFSWQTAEKTGNSHVWKCCRGGDYLLTLSARFLCLFANN